MTEIWKALEFTNNTYHISNYGRLKFLNSKPYENKASKEGYVRFTYKSKIYKVHRLVAEFFCEKKEGNDLVDHINGLRNDNRADNLRWVNHSENNKNRIYGRPIIKPCDEKKVINDVDTSSTILELHIEKLQQEVQYYKNRLEEANKENSLLRNNNHENTMKLFDIINKYQTLMLKSQEIYLNDIINS